MFKELKETMSKDLNEFIRMRDYQIENTNRDRCYKMEPNKNLNLKSITTEMKNSLEGLSSRLEQAEERINEVEDTTVEIIQSEQHRENRLGEEMNRILETCGTITKDPAFVLFESWNEERGAENEYEEIKAENFLKLTRNINIQI